MFDRIKSVFENRFPRRRGLLSSAAVAVAAVWGLAAAAPAQAQIAGLSDIVQFTQRAPAVSEARTLGRAGTGRAGGGDATALYSNPAGLAWMETSAASGGLAIVSAEEEATFDGGDPISEEAGDYGSHFSLAYTFPTTQGSLVLAGAYNRVNAFTREFAFEGGSTEQSITRQTFLPFEDEYTIDGEFIEWSGSIYPQIAYEGGAIEFFPATDELPAGFEPAVLSGTSVEQVGSVGSEGRLNEASFGAGIEAAPDVMVGLSANVSFGRYSFRNAYSEKDPVLPEGVDEYTVIRDGMEFRGLDEVRLEEHFTSDLSGGNLRGGVSAEVAPGIRFGFTAETPTLYQVQETFTEAEITTFFDDGGQLSYGGESGDVGTVDNEYQIRTPWRFGAGTQANLKSLTDGVADLSLSADVEFVDWSQLERTSDALDLSEDQRSNENYEVVFNTSLGAEYRFSGVALRAGFAYRPDPRALGEDAPADPETTLPERDRLFYSLGTGFNVSERFRLDVGWMQERFEDEFAIFPYGTDLAPAADEEVSRTRFLVGVTYSL